MNNKRTINYESGKVGGYKFIKTTNFEGGVTIYIKKRFLGFLWWKLINDINGNPISFNKMTIAEAFMNQVIKYDDVVDVNYKMENDKVIDIISPMTDERAANKICKLAYEKNGEPIPFDCAKAAWILGGRKYIHSSLSIAELWNEIYKFNGKKSWTQILIAH